MRRTLPIGAARWAIRDIAFGASLSLLRWRVRRRLPLFSILAPKRGAILSYAAGGRASGSEERLCGLYDPRTMSADRPSRNLGRRCPGRSVPLGPDRRWPRKYAILGLGLGSYI